MPPETQQGQLPQDSSNTYIATDGSRLNPTAVLLAKSIRKVESNHDYNAVGDNGESHGAYQFNKDNFNTWAQQYGLDPNDMSPVNQDKVAYTRINDLLGKGLRPSEVAAMWNGARATSTGYKAINPQYVEKVKSAYTDYYNEHQNNFVTPPQVSETPVPQSTQEQKPQEPGFIQNLTSGNIGGALHNAFDFAFPVVDDLINDIKGKPDKSALQQLGDLGMSALWFLPFGSIAKGAGLGLKAVGLGTKAAEAGGAIAAGLGAGYAGDVASKLASGETKPEEIATPGLGTAIGGGLAGVGLGVSKIYNHFLGEQNVVNKVAQVYDDAAGATKSGVKGMSKTAARKLEPNSEFLANAGIAPETQEINGRRVFTTGEDSQSMATLQKRASALTDLADEAAAKSAQAGAVTDLNAVKQEMIKRAESEYSGIARNKAIDHINSEMDAYISQFGDKIPLDKTVDIKRAIGDTTKFDATRPSLLTDVNNKMYGALKDTIEKEATAAGVPDIGMINKMIQQHIDAMAFLKRINGQTIKGGRLGTYLTRGAGLFIGSKLGGSGIIGQIGGAIAGEEAGGLVSRWLQKLAAGGPMTAATLGRMSTEEPQIVQQFLEYLGKSGKIAPTVKPVQRSAGGVLQKALEKSPGNLIQKSLPQ